MSANTISSGQILTDAVRYIWNHKRLLGCFFLLPFFFWFGIWAVPRVFKLSYTDSFHLFMNFGRPDIELLFWGLTIFTNALGMKAWMKYILTS